MVNIAKTAAVTVKKTDISLAFTDNDGGQHNATIERVEGPPNTYEAIVDGNQITVERQLNELMICEEDNNGNVTINGKQYSCHEVKDASEGAFLLGNPRYCPYFLRPPGIWINL